MIVRNKLLEQALRVARLNQAVDLPWKSIALFLYKGKFVGNSVIL